MPSRKCASLSEPFQWASPILKIPGHFIATVHPASMTSSSRTSSASVSRIGSKSCALNRSLWRARSGRPGSAKTGRRKSSGSFASSRSRAGSDDGLVKRIGERPVIVVGLALQAVGMAWIGLIAAPDLAYAKLVAPIILAGSGASMAMPAARNTTLSSVSEFEVGKAPGTYYMFRSRGGMSGVAVVVGVSAGTGTLPAFRRSAPGLSQQLVSAPSCPCWERSPGYGNPPGPKWSWWRRMRRLATSRAPCLTSGK
jgi:hypothetical protein